MTYQFKGMKIKILILIENVAELINDDSTEYFGRIKLVVLVQIRFLLC